jgi:hypothetical protein
MPIVSTDTIQFNGQRFVRKLGVDREGTFSIKLPTVVYETLGISNDVYTKTRAEALKKFEEALAEYRESTTTTRKVIVYWFRACCNIQSKGKAPLQLDEISFMDGCGMGLMVNVCNEESSERLTRDGEKTRRYRYTENDDACCIPDNYRLSSKHHELWRHHDEKPFGNVLAWTPEREKAIAELCRRMDMLIAQLHQLFKNKEQLSERLDNIRSLPLPSHPGKNE